MSRISRDSLVNILKLEERVSKVDRASGHSVYSKANRDPKDLPHTWFPAYQGGWIDAAKADVFALGCMMLELISSENPFPKVQLLDSLSWPKEMRLAIPLIPRFRLLPKRCVKHIRNNRVVVFTAACEMLHPDPEKRVTAADAASRPWIEVSQIWID